MNWQVILAGISLLRELLRYFKEQKKCSCPAKQVVMIKDIRAQVAKATAENKDLNITA